MIDPKELRIGNYYYSVVVKDLRQIWVVSRGENTMQPIPLTDAVLEACKCPKESRRINFSTDLSATIYPDGFLHLEIYSDREKAWESLDEVKPCKYLHQLQNLYFALTGKELEIDEEKLKAAVCRATDGHDFT